MDNENIAKLRAKRDLYADEIARRVYQLHAAGILAPQEAQLIEHVRKWSEVKAALKKEMGW